MSFIGLYFRVVSAKAYKITLRNRQCLKEDAFVDILAVLDAKQWWFVKSPDENYIISRN